MKHIVMKRIVILITLLTLLLLSGLGLAEALLAQDPVGGGEPAPGGMPGYPAPDKPIPRHEPGRPTQAGSYTTQVVQENELGAQEAVQISGIEAMAADGLDPLLGNYTLVNWDKILMSQYTPAPSDPSFGNFALRTFNYISATHTVTDIPGSRLPIGNFQANDSTAGDLNGDGQAEQIAAWIESSPPDGIVHMSIGEMPGSLGRTTSAPAVVAGPGGPLDGYALDFNGTNQYVNAGSGINLANNSFSVAFWAKRDNTGRNDYAVGQGTGNPHYGLHIGFRNNNKFTCAFFSNDLDTPAYTDTDWHYWACTYDSGTKLRTIYRDGVQVAQDIASAHYQGSGDLLIGWAPAGLFDGLIDEVGIWNEARTPDQIRAGLIRSAPDATGLVAYWRFNEGSGSTTADASGNSHTGTLTNGPQWNTENAPLAELHLLVRGYDDALWHCFYDVNSGHCLNWNNAAGGTLLSAPAVASRTEGTFDVFVVGTDNQIWWRYFDGSGWPVQWSPVGGVDIWPDDLAWHGSTPELPAPAVVAHGNKLDLFRLGPDNTLRWNHYTGTDWAGWQNLGGMISTGIGAVSDGTDIHVYARGVDEALWHRICSSSPCDSNDDWGEWQRIEGPPGVTIASAPTVVSPTEIYVRGSDDDPWRYNGSSWSNLEPVNEEVELASGVAVAVGQYFAQKSDGSLQISSDGENWPHSVGLTPCCKQFNTGSVAVPPPTNNPHSTLLVDVETGYFKGDGREQIVLAYQASTNQIRIELYDIDAGFTPTNLVTQTATISGTVPRIATGDIDGDGFDEIGIVHLVDDQYHYIVETIDVNPDLSLQSPVDGSPKFYYGGWPWGGTLRITAGDFDGDREDEMAILSDSTARHLLPDPINICFYHLSVQLFIFDDKNRQSGECYTHADCPLAKFDGWPDVARADWSNCTGREMETGVGLAAGDVNRDGMDEIVLTWPYAFEGHGGHAIWPDMYRNLQVLRMNSKDVITEPTEIVTETLPGWQRHSYMDTLAVGDLNRDLKDEIVLYSHADLYAYEFTDSTITELDSIPAANGPETRSINLTAADFRREGLRLGPPRYRVQNRVDSLVAVVNMPPKHRDLIKNGSGQYERIEILTEPCAPINPFGPPCAHTRNGTKTSTESKVAIETQRDWSVGAGLETKAKAIGYFVNTSLNYSYEEGFKALGEYISATTYTQEVWATTDDAIVAYARPYEVWEYPVFSDTTEVPADYLTVVWPKVEESNAPGIYFGDYPCNEAWYAPRHQRYNVWSYDPMEGGILNPDYDDQLAPIYYNSLGHDSRIEVLQSQIDASSTTKTQKHHFDAAVDMGWTNEAKIPFTSYKLGFEQHFKVNGSYDTKKLRTDWLKTEDQTAFSTYISNMAAADYYQIDLAAYWAKPGYLVLDYQTKPGTGATWQKYNKSDPAFILPWYGFPAPTDPVASPCPGKQLFSHDVVIDPPFANVGETVTISATVRNFSDKPLPGNVVVRFYQGPPEQGQVIGEDSISLLNRVDGPQATSITWVAEGAGRQKIYAVLDPDDNIPEMHDENHAYINNNIAYGTMEIGAADYVDMGTAGQQPYNPIGYDQGSPFISLYVPPGNLTATTRFDLKDATMSQVQAVGKPFAVVAYQGSKQTGWSEPIQDFNLKPGSNDPPAVIGFAYEEADITGMNEANLRLWQLQGWKITSELSAQAVHWTEYACPDPNDPPNDYAVQRFPDNNLLLFPICETGVYAVLDELPSLPLQAEFSPDHMAGPGPLTVQFTDESFGGPTVWKWKFGDGSTSEEQHPSHTYTDPGTYNVMLTASNSNGSHSKTELACVNVTAQTDSENPIYLPLILKNSQ